MSFAQPSWGTQLWYGPPTPRPVASWGRRLGGTLVDALCCAIIGGLAWLFAVALPSGVGAVCALVTLGWLVAFAVWNFVHRQGVTGQTVGKSVVGVQLVGQGTGAPIGPFACAVRQALHLVDLLPLGAGFLAAAWDPRGRTWADRLVNTLVVPAPPDLARILGS
ncbi:RDD family protein [Kutzneria albida]|uniref:RDD domain-containing protein n=1 Tax=Kutzneria albida DSM 43870 TaxID=1449976 RepID=W5W117_9PSEU|nr:RDD family protein [Kutzneria albida]AHH94216.1 hypothetical protein KALB_842 [Kutzneria albida DSM 43870]